MPVVRDASGRSKYESPPKIDVSQPEEFFKHLNDDGHEYRLRIAEARYRIIEVIRHFKRLDYGRGFNNEVHGLGRDFSELANFVDRIDSKRAHNLQKQRLRECQQSLAPGERRLRSPQNLKRRRSAIFSGEDFPRGFFKNIAINQIEFANLVDQVRHSIIEVAVAQMWSELEIDHVDDIWYLKVTVLDRHIAAHKHHPTQVPINDRSWHGRPNRDRKRGRFTI